MFWHAADVFYGSVHVDPGAGWFPHVVGYADEVGEGDGAGATLNRPLAPGTGDDEWLAALAATCATRRWRSARRPLVVSLGVDAAGVDPESPLEVSTDGFRARGRACWRPWACRPCWCTRAATT